MKIFIHHLGSSVTPDSLSAIFSTYGKVSGVKILDQPQGRTALVSMPEAPHAIKAISRLHGSYVNGMAMSVRPFSPLHSI